MPRSDRLFVTLFAVILVVGAIAVAIGVRHAGQQAAADGHRMEATAETARALLQLHYAMGMYRVEALRDVDGDGLGEHGPLDEVASAELLGADVAAWTVVDQDLQRGVYRYHAILPAATDDAEQRYAVVALPGEAGLPVLAIDQEGAVRVAPPDFRPDAGAPVDPGTWQRWQ